MNRRDLLKFTIIFLSPGLAIKAADQAGELKKLKGKWTSKDPQGGEATWTFDGDKLDIQAGARAYKIVVKLDSEAKPHKTIEMKVTDDSPNAKNFSGPGIYKFEGDDKLVVCFGTAERPSEFKSKEDFSAIMFELNRKK